MYADAHTSNIGKVPAPAISCVQIYLIAIAAVGNIAIYEDASLDTG